MYGNATKIEGGKLVGIPKHKSYMQSRCEGLKDYEASNHQCNLRRSAPDLEIVAAQRTLCNVNFHSRPLSAPKVGLNPKLLGLFSH